MAKPRIAVVGDYDPGNRTHLMTDEALDDVGCAFEWIATEDCAGAAGERLSGFGGVLIAPASPYRSMDGALDAIRVAREGDVPLVGTWGGFQHVAIEFARNVLGFRDAEHAETSPDAERLVVEPLSCSLVGRNDAVELRPGSTISRLYGASSATESFFCNYGLNDAYGAEFEENGLHVTGRGPGGEGRVVELEEHAFFVGTLFLPQARSTPAAPHPVLVGFAEAASA